MRVDRGREVKWASHPLYMLAASSHGLHRSRGVSALRSCGSLAVVLPPKNGINCGAGFTSECTSSMLRNHLPSA